MKRNLETGARARRPKREAARAAHPRAAYCSSARGSARCATEISMSATVVLEFVAKVSVAGT